MSLLKLTDLNEIKLRVYLHILGFKNKLCNKTKLSNFMLSYKVFSLSDFKWESHDALRRGGRVKIC